MKRLTLQLTPAAAAYDALARASLDEQGMRLARTLQWLAFSDRDEGQSALATMRADPDGFRPGPLYVAQAKALLSDDALRAKFMDHLREAL